MVVQAPVWVWNRIPQGGPSGVSEQMFVPVPFVPPAQLEWFFGELPSDGRIRLVVRNSWQAGSIVEVRARAHDHTLESGHGMTAFGIRLESEGPALDCGTRICSVVRDAFEQQSGVTVSCVAEALDPGEVQLTLSVPGETIVWGSFDICISPRPIEPPPVPVITGFSPQQGGPGTRITLAGENFGTVPDDISLVLLNGSRTLSLSVVEASETEFTAVLGPVPPDAVPGPLEIVLGSGVRGSVQPQFADVEEEDPVWMWSLVSPDAARVRTTEEFTPIPAEPSSDVEWFFAGTPADGALSLRIEGDWLANTRLAIEARAHDLEQVSGFDLRASSVLLTERGSALDCALRICDVLTSSFSQLAGTSFTCEAEEVEPAVARITLSSPGMIIDQGHLSVCVAPPAVRPMRIDGLSPLEGPPGTVVEIIGSSFGDDPDGLSVFLVDGKRSVPFTVIEATDARIVAELGAVPPDAGAGPILVMRGQGTRGTFESGSPDVIVDVPVWVWKRDPPDGAQVMTSKNFQPIAEDPPVDRLWFFSDPPAGGELSLVIGGRWLAGTELEIEIRAHDSGLGMGRGFAASRIRLPGAGDPLDCAERVCGVVSAGFLELGAVSVTCRIEPIEPDLARLVLALPDAMIDRGNFNVCVSPPPAEGSRFVRGDADSSGEIELTDGIVILNFLFTGGDPPACMDAADVDDSGGDRPDISDAIALFGWLFLGRTPPAPPTPGEADYVEADCGIDPTDDAMGCERSAGTCG